MQICGGLQQRMLSYEAKYSLILNNNNNFKVFGKIGNF